MFSQRHPFLFFVLAAGTLLTICVVFFSIVIIAITGFPAEMAGEKVGVIEITGAIVDSRKTVDNIKQFRENEDIKAIVIRINSPGGGVAPGQEIYREIQKTVQQKKVVASMGAVAASGGYYVASAADAIVANPGTVTGSIGVIMGYTNFEEVMRKIGLSPVVIKSGEYKDLGSPTRPMTPGEKTLLETVAREIHDQFISDVAQGRGLEVDQVAAIADGRIITGEQAKALGLVDRLGNYQDAVELAGELAGMESTPVTVYPEKEKLSLLHYLIESILRIWIDARSQTDLIPQARLQSNLGGYGNRTTITGE